MLASPPQPQRQLLQVTVPETRVLDIDDDVYCEEMDGDYADEFGEC